MRPRNSSLPAWRSIFGLLLLLLLAAPAPSQVIRIPREALRTAADLQQLLEQGQQLEQKRKWSEAASHYEQALKEHPGQQDLQRRLITVRSHVDLSRRYADSSFLQSLTKLDAQHALEVYSEVLLKIQTHYVERPNWQRLVAFGTHSLAVALGKPVFQKHHLSELTREEIDVFRRDVQKRIGSYSITSRQDARNAVLIAAQLAQEQLGLSQQATILEYTCGATQALDEYSSFLTADQLDDVFSQIEGNFVGLGIELKADGQALLIVNVISGGPAYQAGIRGGDRIVEVARMSTRDVSTDKAADMLKGPEGSSVELRVVTPDGASRLLQLERRRIEVPSVEDVRMVDPQNGIGYMRLSSFQKTTIRDVDTALWDLHRQGMKYLIVDVRGNPGGLLSASVEVADKFISRGAIVATRGRSTYEDFDYRAHSMGTWRVPLVVLIDGDSASASEIFASAIHDHRRGIVVGQRSYGKGSVQGIFPLTSSKAGIRLTTAKFYSPSGQPISKRGVVPDVVVHSAARPVSGRVDDLQQDAVLQAGIEVAQTRVGQR